MWGSAAEGRHLHRTAPTANARQPPTAGGHHTGLCTPPTTAATCRRICRIQAMPPACNQQWGLPRGAAASRQSCRPLQSPPPPGSGRSGSSCRCPSRLQAGRAPGQARWFKLLAGPLVQSASSTALTALGSVLPLRISPVAQQSSSWVRRIGGHRRRSRDPRSIPKQLCNSRACTDHAAAPPAASWAACTTRKEQRTAHQ